MPYYLVLFMFATTRPMSSSCCSVFESQVGQCTYHWVLDGYSVTPLAISLSNKVSCPAQAKYLERRRRNSERLTDAGESSKATFKGHAQVINFWRMFPVCKCYNSKNVWVGER